MNDSRTLEIDAQISRITSSNEFILGYEHAVEVYGTHDICALLGLDDERWSFAPREEFLITGRIYLDHHVKDPMMKRMLSVPAEALGDVLPMERVLWLIANGPDDGCLVRVSLFFNIGQEMGVA